MSSSGGSRGRRRRRRTTTTTTTSEELTGHSCRYLSVSKNVSISFSASYFVVGSVDSQAILSLNTSYVHFNGGGLSYTHDVQISI